MRLLNLSLTFILFLSALLLFAWGIAAAPATHHVAPNADCAGAMPCYVRQTTANGERNESVG